MSNKYEQLVKEEWTRFHEKNMLLPNIMLLGVTGCGKSSLINRVFGVDLAPVNDVSRGTNNFETYWGKEHGLGVNLIDSRGYEMENGGSESFDGYVSAIQNKMEENRKKAPLEKIHIIWFCISVAAGRVQDYDIQLLRLLLNEKDLRDRVAILLTKCDQDDEDGSIARRLKELLTEELGRAVPTFEVSINPELELDLERLMDWSAEQLDDADMREAFVASQMISLEKKKKSVAARIGFYAAAAAAIGASPIPFSDAALLVPLQIAMSNDIISRYGMDNYVNICKTVLGNVVISNLGKSFAGSLLKLVPGLGTLVGGMINAGVAATITGALGFAISQICYSSCKKIAKGESVDFDSVFAMEEIENISKQFLQHNQSSHVEITDEAKTYAKEYLAKHR